MATSRDGNFEGVKRHPWKLAFGLIASLALLPALSGCGAKALPAYSISGQQVRQASFQARNAVAANRLIVKLKPSGVEGTVARAIGARAVASYPQLGMVVLGLPQGLSNAKALASLAGNGDVKYAEPDYRMKTHLVASDPGTARQWGHKAIDVAGAWDYTVGDPRVVVAVVDTGVDLSHPDLRGRLVGGKTFVPGTNSPADDNGHGTHVAGVIAAEINNGIGIAGVAPGCRVMPVKVLDSKGEGNTSDIVAGLLYAADAGARIINLSLGGGAGGTALEEAIRYAQGKGCLVIAAMGNDGKNAQEYPAAYSGVIGVGATGRSNGIAEFSNFGTWISVSAPGDGIYSTMPTYESTLSESEGAGVGYGYLSGTSMATPYVAGVAALVASLYPNMPASGIKSQIERSTQDLGVPGFDGFFGFGQVSARRALAVK